MSRSLSRFASLLAVLLSLFAGCSEKSKSGETCSNSDDCADGLRCLNKQCGGGGPYVSSEPYTCESDAKCKAVHLVSYPYCKIGGRCVECLTDEHCAGGRRAHCRVTPDPRELNDCVDCLTDAHCTDPREPRCSEGKNKNSNVCTACLTNADCKDPAERLCKVRTPIDPDDAADGECVECLTNADCKTSAKPICRYHSCEAP